MSQEDQQNSNPSSPGSFDESDSQPPTQKSKSGKKKNKASKPRLTAVQKNTNHKDAENKRRNAIRERFTDLSNMVPGAEGQERSEQVMLSKTTDFLRRMIQEQRQLEAMANARGIDISREDRLKDTDFGGPRFKTTHLNEYHAQKVKRGGSGAGSPQDGEED